MSVARGDWSKWLEPGAKKAFVSHFKGLGREYTKYFKIETSQRAFEEYLFSTGLGTVPEKPEFENIARDKPYPRGSVRVIHRSYGLGWEISEETVDDDLYGVLVPKSSRFLADAHKDAEERVAASVFNLAFTTQTGYDGKALIATDHPRIGETDVSNQSATNEDFSIGAAQKLIEHFLLLEDDRGLKLDVMASQVVHHPQNLWIVNEVLRSEFTPYTANNERNIIREFGLEPSSYRYLTDTDAWYGFVPGGESAPMFFWRRRPRTGKTFEEDPGVMFFFVKSRFSVLAPDWRPFYGSTGT